MTWANKDEKIFRKALNRLGIKYITISPNQIKITDASKLIEGLKTYSDEGILIRDMKSGKPGAKEKLDEFRRNKSKE
jgi:hypothetical protein